MSLNNFKEGISQYTDKEISTHEELEFCFTQAILGILDKDFIFEAKLDGEEVLETLMKYKEAYLEIFEEIDN